MATPDHQVFKARCHYSQGPWSCVPHASPETTHSHLARSQGRTLGNRETPLGKQHKLAILPGSPRSIRTYSRGGDLGKALPTEGGPGARPLCFRVGGRARRLVPGSRREI